MRQEIHKHKRKKKFRFYEVALVVMILVFAVFVLLYDKVSVKQQSEADRIANVMVDDHPASLATNGIIDDSKFEEIRNIDYKELKEAIGVKGDFCIYLEDGNGQTIMSKGSSKLRNDGIECTE